MNNSYSFIAIIEQYLGYSAYSVECLSFKNNFN